MNFKTYLGVLGLKEATIKNHERNLGKMMPTLDIKQDIKYLKGLPSNSQQLTQSSTFSKYYKFSEVDNQPIINFIAEVNKATVPAELNTTVTLKEIKAKMNNYFKDEKYKEFIVCFLLLKFQTRNLDLVLEIVSSEQFEKLKEHPKADKTNFLVVSPNKVMYLRSNYKTASKYGDKQATITSKKFIKACEERIGEELIKYANASKDVKSIVGVSEGQFAKLFLQENNNSKSFKKVSKNRGTDLTTLLNSYTDTN